MSKEKLSACGQFERSRAPSGTFSSYGHNKALQPFFSLMRGAKAVKKNRPGNILKH